MAFMKTKQYESTPNILESEVGLVLKTYTADATNATAVNDKKIIKAGSVYPTNGNGAKGIVFEDVDMAEEMTEYTKYNVLQQAGTSVLAQANELPTQALQLLQ